MDTEELCQLWRKFKANQPIHTTYRSKRATAQKTFFKHKMAAKMPNCADQQTRTRHPAVSEPQNACNVHCWGLKGEGKCCWLQQISNTLEISSMSRKHCIQCQRNNLPIPFCNRFIHFNLPSLLMKTDITITKNWEPLTKIIKTKTKKQLLSLLHKTFYWW